MGEQILTEVSATVPEDRAAEILLRLERLVARPVPDGLVRTELLAGADAEWRIQTLWRDRAALDAMRASSEEPAAPALFRAVGAEPRLRVLQVLDRYPVA